MITRHHWKNNADRIDTIINLVNKTADDINILNVQGRVGCRQSGRNMYIQGHRF